MAGERRDQGFGLDFRFVLVCPLTTTRRGLDPHVEVEATADTGLDDTSYVHCELLRSINRRRLVNRIGAVDRTISANVHLVVRTLLDH